MTDREKEIRTAERKALAEVRTWKRKAAKRRAGMTAEQLDAYYKRIEDNLRAKGIKVAEPVE